MVDARMPEFPRGFRWGAATAAFQVEGATRAAGRGDSVWDVFTRTPGRVLDGSNADVAADSYRRWRDDVALLAELGVDDYRFSIAWPRVQPSGAGPANEAGLDHYARLVDALLEAGIRPMPTLYHWDLPQPLEDAGGWLSRDTAARFADYVELVLDRLADRVGHWITLNEPAMTTLQGYALGTLAPGHALMMGALPTAHHQLLAHGLAVRAIRAAGDAEVGIVNNHTLVEPASDDPGDLVAAASVGSEFAAAGLPFEPVDYPGVPVTGFGWPVVPEALTELLVSLRTDYGAALPPVVITENGASYPDEVVDDRVHDAERIAYLDGHIRAVHTAIERGVDVRGYLVWSLIDNFEWADGYTQRFGLVHLDLETGERTRKDSFDWYRELVAAQRG